MGRGAEVTLPVFTPGLRYHFIDLHDGCVKWKKMAALRTAQRLNPNRLSAAESFVYICIFYKLVFYTCLVFCISIFYTRIFSKRHVFFALLSTNVEALPITNILIHYLILFLITFPLPFMLVHFKYCSL